MHFPVPFLPLFLSLSAVLASAITVPPVGAIIVRKEAATDIGEFATVASAVAAAGPGPEKAVIFIYPGIYEEQVFISRTGPLTIYGYSSDRSKFSANEVTIRNSLVASAAGSNDLSGTVRIHSNDVALYSLTIENNWGHPAKQNQAIALSLRGDRSGFYAVKLVGYQDTLLTNSGRHFFGRSYIEGAVDFIFGQFSQAYFTKSEIASSGPGYVTASGRMSDDAGVYVLDNCKFTLAASATADTTGKVYLGRPWRAYARVIIQESKIESHIRPEGWSVWAAPPEERISNILFGEHNNGGTGQWDPNAKLRASFATKLNASWTIQQALGDDALTWVDRRYM